jgi:hypothetical protein
LLSLPPILGRRKEYPCCLLGALFDPEDGSRTFLKKKTGELLLNYMVEHPGDSNLEIGPTVWGLLDNVYPLCYILLPSTWKW